MLCVSSMQGNCSPWSQYFTNCHFRNATHFFRARELLPLVAIFYELSLQKCYAFLPCRGIAPLGRNILRIAIPEMLTHFFRAGELLPLVAIFYELPFQKCLRISSVQGNCSPWSQYFTNCHSRNATHFFHGNS